MEIEWGIRLDATTPRAASPDSHGDIANPGTDNERLFEGYLQTSTSNTIGADITGLSQHFATYDVYVYLDADDGRSRSGNSVRSITDGTTTYFLDDADGNTFAGEFIEVTSTDGGLPGVGNYVVFRGLTGDAVSIRIDNDTTISSSSSNRPAISAIQVVGVEDAMDAAALGEIVIGSDTDRDIVLGDDGLARLFGGVVYEVASADTDQSGSDTIRTGIDADLVLGGGGGDAVDGGAGHDVLLGDSARVVRFDGEIIGLDRNDHAGNFDPFEVDGIQLLDQGFDGDDSLTGGADDDLSYGQGGDDSYVFAGLGLGQDHLAEIGNGEAGVNDFHDRLDFSAFGASVNVEIGPGNLRTVNGGTTDGDIDLRLRLSSSTAFEDVIDIVRPLFGW